MCNHEIGGKSELRVLICHNSNFDLFLVRLQVKWDGPVKT